MKTAALVAVGVVGGVAFWWYRQQQAGQGMDIAQGAADTVNGVTETLLGAIGMRGIRNNNPGNIRHSGARWQGMSAQQTDSAFVQFDSPEMGIRALSRLLDNYAKNYGLNTVRGIVSRFAPASENNTTAYMQDVARALGVGVDQQIDVQARKLELLQAIIRHENGLQPYSLATIQAGVNAA